MARWIERLGNYDIDIKHRPGTQHGNADGLSRRPCGECSYCDRKELKELQVTDQGGTCRAVLNDEQDSFVIPDVTRAATGLDFPADGWIEPWSRQDIVDWQKADDTVKTVLSWMDQGLRPPWCDIQVEGSTLREYWSKWEQLERHDGVLYRRSSVDDQSGDVLRLIAPAMMRSRILTLLHNDRTAGHMGITKTLYNVRRRFWWPGLRGDVESWCSACRPCQMRNQRSGRKRAKLHQDPVGSPWERVAVDILSIPTESQRGNTCVLVVGDYFTKWTEAFALPNHQAVTVADVLVTEVFLRFGVPRILHSDQGREFQSDLIQELCAVLGVTKTRTAPYHPQSDGQIERFNRTLIAMLSKLSEADRENWDDYLPYALCAYRATVNESTGCSPNRMMFGHEMSLPIDLMYISPQEEVGYRCATEYVEWVKQALAESHEKAREVLRKSASRQKRYYDKRAQERTFKEGDWVLRLYPPLGQDKLNYKYVGPYLITKRLGDVTFLIQKDENARPLSVHTDDLKRYYGTDVPKNWLEDRVVEGGCQVDCATQCDILTGLAWVEEQVSSSDEEPETIGPCPYHALSPSSEPSVRPRMGARTRRPPKRFGWD